MGGALAGHRARAFGRLSLADEVEIEAAPGLLPIRPSLHPRAGWAEAAAAFDAEGLLDAMTTTRFDDEEWLWRRMTTGGHPYPFRLRYRFDGKDTCLVADRLRAVDRDRLMKHLGTLVDAKMVEVFSVLRSMVAE